MCTYLVFGFPRTYLICTNMYLYVIKLITSLKSHNKKNSQITSNTKAQPCRDP